MSEYNSNNNEKKQNNLNILIYALHEIFIFMVSFTMS
ncbi:hypothetical protein BANRA_01780 [Klebsiella pneumoniae]|nr:hypothetical protein BANRA_01780 [Klebsiella pneumoniae]